MIGAGGISEFHLKNYRECGYDVAAIVSRTRADAERRRDEFGVGDPVQIVDLNGTILGNGLVNYAASDIHKIKGLKSVQIASRLGEKPYDEVIHRDNLAITAAGNL